MPLTQASERLAVVFVTFNSADVLNEALASVRAKLPGAEIVVVDNGSTDATQTIARDGGDILVEGHGNVGFGAGVNLGVAAARRPYVLVVNPDAPVFQADLTRLAAKFDADRFGVVAASEEGAAGPEPLLRPEYPWRAELCWSLVAWFVVPAELTLAKPKWGRRPLRFSGAAFLVDRNEFLGLGGFDERLFLYHEDEELSGRYLQAGYPVTATDALVVRHDQGSSSPRNHERILAWQLLSFVQLVAARDGVEAAERSARWVRRGLRLIETVGHALRRAPVVGKRSATKAASASLVWEHLLTEAASPPRGTTYPQAAAAVLAVTR